MRESLKVTRELLLLDLGEVKRLMTQDGPRLARYVAVLRGEAATYVRTGQGLGLRLVQYGVPPAETLGYVLPVDLLEVDETPHTLGLPGLRVYLSGPPEFVETPYYAWVQHD